jgi:hypothetical protein
MDGGVHTSRALSSTDFSITVAGRPATLADVLPGFDEHARLGIVVTQAGGAAGASTLILAAVTAFYDRLRATEGEFFAYADYFAFHVGQPRGSLRKLDVFPEHKEPVVADESEEILRAINDRGVTHLLVPDGETRSAQLGRDTRHSARRRLRTAIAYAPSGRVAEADIAVTAAPQAEQFVTAMLGRPRDIAGEDGRPRETFRRLPLDDALGMLETVAQ